MYKTDQIWYNSVMNKIVFAGKKADLHDIRNNKYFEFIIPEKDGRGVHIPPNGENYRVGRGEIAVVPPFCNFNGANYGDGAVHVLMEHALLPLKEVLIMADDENDGIRHAAEQAVIYFSSDCEKKEAVLAALGNLLVSYVIFSIGDGKKYSPVAELIRADIDSNISDATYSIEDSLKKLPLNYDYMRKLFKKEIGLTPHEYLTSKRMELAFSLLTSGVSNRYSNYSVSQVAEACGFAEPLYFSRVFKKYYGKSPSDYLKK